MENIAAAARGVLKSSSIAEQNSDFPFSTTPAFSTPSPEPSIWSSFFRRPQISRKSYPSKPLNALFRFHDAEIRDRFLRREYQVPDLGTSSPCKISMCHTGRTFPRELFQYTWVSSVLYFFRRAKSRRFSFSYKLLFLELVAVSDPFCRFYSCASLPYCAKLDTEKYLLPSRSSPCQECHS